MKKINQYGDGNTVLILIHGGPSLYGYMDTLGGKLKDNYTIVTYAQRGTSANPSKDKVTTQDHINDLIHLAEKYSDKEVILIGHSWGASLALMTLSEKNFIASKAILIGTGPLTEELAVLFSKNLNTKYCEKTKKLLDAIEDRLDIAEENNDDELFNSIMNERLEITSPFYHLDPKTQDLIPKLDWNFTSFDSTLETQREILESVGVENILSKINIPIFAFHGESDPIPAVETLEFLNKHIPKLQTQIISQSGHFPWLEKTSENEFLKLLNKTINL